MNVDQQLFAWSRVRGLFGLPLRDARVRQLFLDAGLDADVFLREVRVGIYAMPPHDQQPTPIREIDLAPSFHVRLRFKHSRLVLGVDETLAADEWVFAALTYFLESKDPREQFQAGLPYDIRPNDDAQQIINRVGRPPVKDVELDDVRYISWEDRHPVLHVLLSKAENRILKVNVFLAPNPRNPV